mgnify:CR=1 FL=1
MLFLISPAKALDYETPPHVATHTQPLFVKQAGELIDVLREQSPQQIAELGRTGTSRDMQITARTVKMHRAGIMQRLGLGHVADLVRFYERVKHLLDTPAQPPSAPRSAEPQRDWALLP